MVRFSPLGIMQHIHCGTKLLQVKENRAAVKGSGKKYEISYHEGVRKGGLEPPRDLIPLDPESSASANSTTSASGFHPHCNQKYGVSQAYVVQELDSKFPFCLYGVRFRIYGDVERFRRDSPKGQH